MQFIPARSSIRLQGKHHKAAKSRKSKVIACEHSFMIRKTVALHLSSFAFPSIRLLYLCHVLPPLDTPLALCAHMHMMRILHAH